MTRISHEFTAQETFPVEVPRSALREPILAPRPFTLRAQQGAELRAVLHALQSDLVVRLSEGFLDDRIDITLLTELREWLDDNSQGHTIDAQNSQIIFDEETDAVHFMFRFGGEA